MTKLSDEHMITASVTAPRWAWKAFAAYPTDTYFAFVREAAVEVLKAKVDEPETIECPRCKGAPMSCRLCDGKGRIVPEDVGMVKAEPTLEQLIAREANKRAGMQRKL